AHGQDHRRWRRGSLPELAGSYRDGHAPATVPRPAPATGHRQHKRAGRTPGVLQGSRIATPRRKWLLRPRVFLRAGKLLYRTVRKKEAFSITNFGRHDSIAVKYRPSPFRVATRRGRKSSIDQRLPSISPGRSPSLPS